MSVCSLKATLRFTRILCQKPLRGHYLKRQKTSMILRSQNQLTGSMLTAGASPLRFRSFGENWMKTYKVELSDRFKREFRKLDKYTQKILRAWIDKNLVDCENPRAHGKGLTANRSGQWRYRIGDYRLICSIEDDRLVILALTVGHRSEIYKQQIRTGRPTGG